MDLSIIIVNYKSRDKLANCLKSISTSDLLGISFEVVIVENNSGDQLEGFSSMYPFVRLIKSDCNLGMGGGNNLGVKNSSGEFILISNPDIVFQTESIREMMRDLKSDRAIGLVGPRLLYPDGTLQYSCARFPRWYMPILRRTFLGYFFKKTLADFTMENFDHLKSSAVDWLFGACLLVRRSDFSEQALFDNRFFMYFEDTDLCRRIWKRGQAVHYCASAPVFHDHQRDSASKNIFSNHLLRVHIQSWWQYFLKWGFSTKR